MLWIWLFLRHRHKWNTGPVERYFTFVCASCAASLAAMVRSFGAGSGRTIDEAQRRAQTVADTWAENAVQAASCPCCGALQPAILNRFATVEKKLARRRALRLPVALAVFVVAGGLLAIPALRDIHVSLALGVVAVASATALAALAFALLSSRVAQPPTTPYGVWFSREPLQGPQGWYPAQPGVVPALSQTGGSSQAVSLVVTSMMAIVSVVALVAWFRSFRTIYVVSSEDAHGSLAVEVDGARVGKIGRSFTGQDAASEKFEVRVGSPHHLVVTDAAGRALGYDLDPATAKHGWVVAPRARERGLCLVSITWHYDTSPTDHASPDSDDGLLNVQGDGDVVALEHSFDYVLRSPPATIQTQQSSETRSSLRALACEPLERDEVVPFKAR